MYYPHQSVAIDEAMVAWHGKLSFRVYSPDKPVKYGLKVIPGEAGFRTDCFKI